MACQWQELHSEHACSAWGNVYLWKHPPPYQHPCAAFSSVHKSTQIREKQLTGWCLCWFLDCDVHAGWICPALAGQIFPCLYNLLVSIGNGSCVWIACFFAFCFHPWMSKERLLPLLWLWKDFVA